MNKFFKVSLSFLGVLIVVGIFLYVKLFLIGSVSYENVNISKVTLKSNELIIKGEILDSGHAYKDYEYTLVDSEIYVTIKSVMVSNKHKSGSFEISIPVDTTNIKNVHLTDNKKTKVVYSK